VKFLYIGLFGLVGVYARYFVGGWVGARWPNDYPAGTFFINMGGSFLIGVVWVLGKEHTALSDDLLTGLMAGLLGGYTTFSSYILETSHLFEDGRTGRALAYFCLSPILGLACAMAGLHLTRWLTQG
jgi:CrcB protein